MHTSYIIVILYSYRLHIEDSTAEMTARFSGDDIGSRVSGLTYYRNILILHTTYNIVTIKCYITIHMYTIVITIVCPVTIRYLYTHYTYT